MNKFCDNDYLIRFSDCIPVKGEFRSINCDLTRSDFEFIPNDLCNFLEQNNKLSWGEISRKYKESDIAIIEEYIDFLLEKEYIFWGTQRETEFFPEIEQKFKIPFDLSNVIIEINPGNIEITKKGIKQTLSLGAKHYQLRSFEQIDFDILDDILNMFLESRVNRIEIFIPYNKEYSNDKLEVMIDKHLRISNLFLFNSPLEQKFDRWRSQVICTHKNSLTHNDFINKEIAKFTINIDFFMESLSHNTYYNKKACIDKLGNIKNSLELDETFGNIANTDLEIVIKSAEFQKLWNLSKDIIEDCKTCEFRNICFDCRKPQFDGVKYFFESLCTRKMRN